jgi:hypothetical protein
MTVTACPRCEWVGKANSPCEWCFEEIKFRLAVWPTRNDRLRAQGREVIVEEEW